MEKYIFLFSRWNEKYMPIKSVHSNRYWESKERERASEKKIIFISLCCFLQQVFRDSFAILQTNWTFRLIFNKVGEQSVTFSNCWFLFDIEMSILFISITRRACTILRMRCIRSTKKYFIIINAKTRRKTARASERCRERAKKIIAFPTVNIITWPVPIFIYTHLLKAQTTILIFRQKFVYQIGMGSISLFDADTNVNCSLARARSIRIVFVCGFSCISWNNHGFSF